MVLILFDATQGDAANDFIFYPGQIVIFTIGLGKVLGLLQAGTHFRQAIKIVATAGYPFFKMVAIFLFKSEHGCGIIRFN